MEANSILQVIEYLNKKGYSKTEAMLRMESANQDADGRSIASRAGDPTGAKYGRAFSESQYDPYYDEVTKLFSLDATVDRGRSRYLQGEPFPPHWQRHLTIC